MTREEGLMSDRYDVVIIGAGMAGLVLATALAQKGLKVRVIEQHAAPGGYQGFFRRKGFTFDTCLHNIAEAGEGGSVGRIFAALGLGGTIGWIPLDPLYRAVFPDHDLLIPADFNRHMDLLFSLFPKERKGIEDLFLVMEGILKELGQLPSPGKLLLKYRESVFQELLDEHLSDARLKAILSSLWAYLGYPPSRISALLMSAFLSTVFTGGLYYPAGGAEGMVNTLVRAFQQAGGELSLKQKVRKIITLHGTAKGVETADGERVESRVVVSTAAAAETFLSLIEKESLLSDPVQFLEGMEVGLSAFSVYLGVAMEKEEAEYYGQAVLAHSSYDSDEESVNLLKGDVEGSNVSLALPTMADTSLAPDKHACLSIYTPVPYHVQGIDWREEKEAFAERLIRRAEKIIPDLSHRIVVKETASPLTQERYTSNTMGATLGWAPTPKMLFGRPQNKTPLDKLYLAGHWTFPGGGVNSVIQSGWMTANMILAEWGRG